VGVRRGTYLPVPGYVLAVALLDGVGELATAHGVWTTTLEFSCLAVLTMCAVPRPVVPATSDVAPPSVPSRSIA
jgi:hypothetical protein